MSKAVGEMVRSRSVQVKASAGTEGARRATGVPADGPAGGAGPLAPGQRWSVGRKRDVVLRLLRGVRDDSAVVPAVRSGLRAAAAAPPRSAGRHLASRRGVRHDPGSPPVSVARGRRGR